MGIAAMPAAKPKNFRGSFRRLLGELRPGAAARSCSSWCFAIVSVSFAIIGPKILGNATNIIFEGVVGKQLPAGVTQEQAVAALRAQRPGPARRHAREHARRRPAQGIDFGALGADPPASLIGVYVAELGLRLGPGLHHGRRHPADRLPAAPATSTRSSAGCRSRYFDSHPRGDILSRVTNDIDNIGQTLQQSLTQLITALLHGHRRPGHDVLDQPAPGRHLAARSCPLSIVVTVLIAEPLAEAVRGPVGADRHAQRPRRGDAHRARDRQGRSGASAEAIAKFDEENERALPGQLQGPVHLRDHPAGDELHRQPQLRRDRGHRRRAGGERADDPRRRPGVHPVLAPVHDADRPDGQHRERPAVGGRLGRARLRAARRGRGDRPRPATPRELAARRGAGRLRGRVASATCPTRRSSRTWTSSSSPARRSPSSARPAPARRRSSTCSCASTRSTAGAITIDGIDIRDLTRDDAAAHRSGWSSRTRGCSTARSARTSPTAARARPRRRSSAAARGRPRRPLRADPARRLRHRHRRRRDEPVGRREAAADDRPGLPGRPARSSSSTRRRARSTRAPRC